jgi:hypothetical protein
MGYGFGDSLRIANMVDEQQDKSRIQAHAAFLTTPFVQRDQLFIEAVRIGYIGRPNELHDSIAPFARESASAMAVPLGDFQRAATY